MNDIRDDVAATFAELFAHPPTGLWSAPGRVVLLGDRADDAEGLALSFAINRRTVIALGLRDDATVRVGSGVAGELVELAGDELASARLGGWSAGPLGVVRALRGSGDPGALPGVDIYLDSSVPVGVGLSSSAALESAVAIALNEVWQLGLERPALAAAGWRSKSAEVDVADRFAVLLGRPDHAILLDRGTLKTELVPLGFAEADLHLLVIDTGVEFAADGYGRARELPDDETFRRVRHPVTENERVLEAVRVLREHRPAAIGALLDASNASLRDDFESSTAELELAVETARAAGAIGARMMGGFAGSVIALATGGDLSRIRVAIDGAFAEHGFPQPTMFVLDASDGAIRE